MFSGSITALVTPMYEDGRVDFESLRNLVEWHIASGTSALVVIGTTGEAATLNVEEQLSVVKTAVDVSHGRIPIIAGNGSNATAKTIEITHALNELNIDGCLCVTPYYNKPTQQGLIEHFSAVADASNTPVILYNVPSRTGCDLSADSVKQLAGVANIVAIKEASTLDRIQQHLEINDPSFAILSGEDVLAFEAIRSGAHGVISVTANVAPRAMSDMCSAIQYEQLEKATQLNESLSGLHTALFVESNPTPVKWVMHQLGLIPAGIRKPLLPLSDEHVDVVKNAMYKAGLNPAIH